MAREWTVAIVPSSVRPGRCRCCRAPIVWAVTASKPGRPSRTLPFNQPPPYQIRQERNAETGVLFEIWPRAALHVVTCRRRTVNRHEARA